jgi:WD40 repeat protein
LITGRRAYQKWFVRGLIVFAIGMTAFASIASREHHATENQRNSAQSRFVALESREFERSDPSLAMQLALIAYRLSQTTEARSALVDVTAGEMPTRLLGRPGQTLLALGDDGHRVAVGYQGNNTVALYTLRYAQLTELTTVPGGFGSAQVDAVALSDNGHLLAVGNSAGRVALWSLSSALHPRRLAVLHAGRGAVRGLSFSPAGGSLAAADGDGTVQRWSLATPSQPALAPALIAPGRPAFDALSYSHDGSSLAAVAAHGTLDVWAAHGGSAPLAHDKLGTATVTAVNYSPDGQSLAAGDSDGSVWLQKLGAGGLPEPSAAPLAQAGSGVTSLAFSRDGRYLAAGTTGRSAPIWSVAGAQLVATLPHAAAVTGVAFTDGDRRLISANATGTTMLWQFPAPSTYTFGSALTALTYSLTAPRLTVTLKSGRSDVWDVVTEWRPAPVGTWYAAPLSDAPLHAYWIPPVSTSTATTTTATGTSTTTTTPVVVNPHAGDQALRRTRAQTTVTSSLLSPNGEFFAAASSDGVIWLWNVSDPAGPQLISKLSGFTAGVTAMIFTASSQTLFAGSADHTVRIWGLSNPTSPLQLPDSPLIGPRTAITKLALSPDNRMLAVATIDGHVWLWSVSNTSKASVSGDLLAARGDITALSFSPSDNVLVAGGSGRRLTFWHYRPYQAGNRVCALEGTPITPTEWTLYVPGAAYSPPCAKWTPPVAKTVTTPAP